MGDGGYILSPEEYLEGIEAMKAAIPFCPTKKKLADSLAVTGNWGSGGRESNRRYLQRYFDRSPVESKQMPAIKILSLYRSIAESMLYLSPTRQMLDAADAFMDRSGQDLFVGKIYFAAIEASRHMIRPNAITSLSVSDAARFSLNNDVRGLLACGRWLSSEIVDNILLDPFFKEIRVCLLLKDMDLVPLSFLLTADRHTDLSNVCGMERVHDLLSTIQKHRESSFKRWMDESSYGVDERLKNQFSEMAERVNVILAHGFGGKIEDVSKLVGGLKKLSKMANERVKQR